MNVCEDSCAAPLSERGKGKGKDGGRERRERTPIEKAAVYSAWAFFLLSVAISFFWEKAEGQENAPLVVVGESALIAKVKGFLFQHLVPFIVAGALAGVAEVKDFLFQHLISAMIPAFFLAAAISTFFSKQTIIKAMGRQTNPLISYPIASLAGAILTVCSCGVLPIFMSVLQSGAGIGPAITFLYASPAINLISLIYTWKILPASMLWGRVIGVAISAIVIGLIMFMIFPEQSTEPEADEASGKKGNRSAAQEGLFFCLLILVMLTSTDALSFITRNLVPASLLGSAFFGATDPEMATRIAALAGKLLALLFEILVVIGVLKAWFTWDETRKWLKRTGRQVGEILPMVFLGIFYSGMLGGAPSLLDYLGTVRENTILANLISSLIGAMLYFGSIVGVNVVDLFMRWGMHKGPALALLLSGPSVSLPSVFAIMPIIGKKKTFTILALVVVFSAACGMMSGFI